MTYLWAYHPGNIGAADKGRWWGVMIVVVVVVVVKAESVSPHGSSLLWLLSMGRRLKVIPLCSKRNLWLWIVLFSNKMNCRFYYFEVSSMKSFVPRSVEYNIKNLPTQRFLFVPRTSYKCTSYFITTENFENDTFYVPGSACNLQVCMYLSSTTRITVTENSVEMGLRRHTR